MRALSAAALAAVNAVVTAPGHLVDFVIPGVTIARWSDIGQLTQAGVTYAAVDMKVAGIAFNADGKPTGFSLTLGNLDSSIAAFVLANDIASATVYISSIDRAAIALADAIPLGAFGVTQSRIGIDNVAISCAPPFFTAPLRRVDAANGFRFATPEGTLIIWGREPLILDRLNDDYYIRGV